MIRCIQLKLFPRASLSSARSLSMAAVMLLSILVMAVASHAQQAPRAEVTADSINDEVQETLAASRQKLSTVRERLEQPGVDDMRLAELRVQAEDVASEVQGTSAEMETRLAQIEARLADLGEPPAAGQPPEAAAVTEERNRLTTERAELTVLTDDAAGLMSSANQTVATISTLRRDLFAQTLFKRTQLSGELFVVAGESLVLEIQELGGALGSWLSFAWKFKKLPLLASIFLSLGAALVFLSGGRRLFARLILRNASDEWPTYIKRLSLAFWSTVTRTLSLAAFLVASFLFLDGFNVLRRDIAPILAALFSFIWFVYFVSQLSYAVLSPRHSEWRLVRVTDRGAQILVTAIVAMAAINGLDYLLGAISEVLSAPLELTIAKSVVASLVIGVILLGLSFVRPIMAEGKADAEGRAWPRWLGYLLRVMGVLLLLTVLAGYAGLARFVATQIVLTGAVLVTVYIGILSGKAVGKQGVFAHTAVGERLGRRFNLGEVALDQVGLVAGLAIYVFALLLGIPLILLTWGFQITDIEVWVYRFFTRITIGNISISIVGILGGLLLFGLGYLATKWIQRWIDSHVLERSQVDAGVRNSVKTGIGYLGIGLAVIVGVSAAGVNLSSLALVASALSVGIGFGLQNVVSNFVSGLILLVERPFKVGDHIVTGTTEGIVKRISVRATEVETFRKQSIIVPNSDLINAPVGNWTHRNKVQRSEVPVSVAYGTDPEKVIAILLEIVEAVPEVLRNPEPHVDFMAFGASSLDFELRFHLADYTDGIRIRALVRIEILRRFEKEGIEIPFARQDIMILPRPRREDLKSTTGPADAVEDGAGV
ncbi:mechanosensitive ion channel [Rhizobium sp. TRM95001]|nr:mechanosensitive ion channel [Rhizobium halophilum]